MITVDVALTVHIHIAQLNCTGFLHSLERMDHCVMFDRARNSMFYTGINDTAPDGRIVSFGASGGKKYFGGRCVQEVGDGLARLFDQSPYLAAVTMY